MTESKHTPGEWDQAADEAWLKGGRIGHAMASLNNAKMDALEAINADLLAALELLRHDDGCFCEAAFAMLGQHIPHSRECIMACDAIDKAKGETP